MTRGRWPLHPAPGEYETLFRWVKRIAAAYEVSMSSFCRQALGLDREHTRRLLTDDPPISALLKLEAGTAIPMEQLRSMSVDSVVARAFKKAEELANNDFGRIEPLLRALLSSKSHYCASAATAITKSKAIH
jgi:hypothetical protein